MAVGIILLPIEQFDLVNFIICSDFEISNPKTKSYLLYPIWSFPTKTETPSKSELLQAADFSVILHVRFFPTNNDNIILGFNSGKVPLNLRFPYL